MSRIKDKIPMIASIILVIIGIFVSYFHSSMQPKQYSAYYIDTFNTATKFIGYAEDETTFKKNADVLNEKLIEYHKLYDIYNSYDGINNLKTINDNAGITAVVVDTKIIDLLKYSIDLYKQTNGETNIAMGSVLKIWHYYRSFGHSLPSMEELENAARHTDINNIIIDEAASTVYLADPEMSLDVGSIGKGYAVQMVAEYARELGYNNLAINCGGNVVSVGPRADKSSWTFGIQNPDLEAADDILLRVCISDSCIVTSGDYQRYYVVDGVEYCHIIDPDTLMPADYFQSVSIIAPHSGKADALSTALFNMPYEEGLALINSIEDVEAVWVFEDGTIKYSQNFKDYIANE